MTKVNSPPRALGYRMPAEWEPHEATWLAWRHDQETWPHELPLVESTYLDIIEHLHKGERVHVLVEDSSSEARVLEKLGRKGVTENILIHQVKTDSIWIRDYGPTFLVHKQGQTASSDWIFNAWGRKYAAYQEDDQVPGRISDLVPGPRFQVDMVLEGGAIDVNGLGTCLLTEQCLLNPNRNPSLSRMGIERNLRDYVGVSHFIWLSRGLSCDDTDGHVDTVARFISPSAVVAALDWNERNPNYSLLKENWEKLIESVDQDGFRLNIVTLPMPEPVMIDGVRFPASYANFYIGNSVVLVPVYDCKSDRIALDILNAWFPDRDVVGIDSKALVRGLGGIHCITHEQPACP